MTTPQSETLSNSPSRSRASTCAFSGMARNAATRGLPRRRPTGHDGVELVEHLRERYVDIPAILITGNELRLSSAQRHPSWRSAPGDGALLDGKPPK